MRRFKLLVATVAVISVCAGAQADDKAATQDIEEVIVAAPYPSRLMADEIAAASKPAVRMPEITLAVADLKLMPPRMDSAVREPEAK